MNLDLFSERKWYFLVVLGICVLFSFVLYAPTLSSYFIAEDLRHITFDWDEVENEFLGAGQSLGYRPGSTLYLVINNKLWGRNPIGHHVVVAFIHAITGWLVGLIMFRMTKNFVMATMAALIFIGAPVQMDSVIWLAAAAGTVTSTFVCMLATWIWINTDNPKNYISISFVAFLYLTAILIKEFALTLPGLLILFDWAMKRRFHLRTFKAITRSLVYYWLFFLVLGIYAFLYWNSNALKDAISYGLLPGLNPLYILGRLSFSAHDLLLPLSKIISLRSGIGNLFWIPAIGVLIRLSRMRWTFALAFVALLPSLFVSGGRMTYLAMVGFSMGVAALLLDLAGWALNKTSSRLFYPALIGVSIILLAGYAIDVYRTSLIFIEAGKVNWSIPRQAKALVPELPPNAELYFIGFPEEAAFRWGIVHEVRYMYGDPELSVHIVVDGPPAWDKISLQSIPCDEDTPRFYFKYFADENILSLVSASEFGLSCQ